MSMEIWAIALGAWVVTGFLAAILFGHMVPTEERDRNESLEPGAADNLKYFRRTKRVASSRKRLRGATKRNYRTRDASSGNSNQ